MHLAVLMTNTDRSDFSDAHPKDGEKFTAMIHSVRPEWQVTSFDVIDDVFPQDITAFDGVMITGSPASVHDSDAWILRLEGIIREIYASHMPIFGACFGHQAIAKALGGTVENNPGGWVFGVTQAQITARPTWASDLPDTLTQYAAHVEQVTTLPDSAEILLISDACPAGGFAIANRVYTTQNHPEMTHEFITALVAEYADKLPADVAQTAEKSLSKHADSLAYAESVARFFEQAA